MRHLLPQLVLLVLGVASSVRSYGDRKTSGARFDAPLGGGTRRTIQRPRTLSSEYLPPKEDTLLREASLKLSSEYLPPKQDSPVRAASSKLSTEYLPPRQDIPVRQGSLKLSNKYLPPNEDTLVRRASLKLASEYLPPGKQTSRRSSLTRSTNTKNLTPRTGADREALVEPPNAYIPPAKEAAKASLRLSDEYLPPKQSQSRQRDQNKAALRISDKYLPPKESESKVVLKVSDEYLPPKKEAPKAALKLSGEYLPPSRRQTTLSRQNQRQPARKSSQTDKSVLGSRRTASRGRGTKRYRVPDYLKSSDSIKARSQVHQLQSSRRRFGQLTQAPSSTFGSTSQQNSKASSSQLDEAQLGSTSEKTEEPSDPDVELIDPSLSTADVTENRLGKLTLGSYSSQRTDLAGQTVSEHVVAHPGNGVNIQYFTTASHPAVDIDSIRAHDIHLAGDELLSQTYDGHLLHGVNNPISFRINNPYEYGSLDHFGPVVNDPFEPVLNGHFGPVLSDCCGHVSDYPVHHRVQWPHRLRVQKWSPSGF